MASFDLTGKVALVTGAGRGLGLGMAEALAEAGCGIAAVARTRDQLGRAVAHLQSYGGPVVGIPWDVGSGDDAHELVAEATERIGVPDVLVHAAGNQVRRSAADFTLAEWDQVLGIHLRAAFALSQAVAAQLRSNRRPGSIIFIGSLTSHIGVRNTVAYGSAKTGVLGLTRNLALEWAADGIRSNAILPGYFHTALTDDLMKDEERTEAMLARIPMGRFGLASDLGGAAVFLAADASSYMTGQSIAVDGGWLGA